MRDLAGRVAFVTGAGGGIGAGISRALAAQGAQLALADLQPELLARRRAEFEFAGVRVATFALDVTDPAAIGHVAAEVEASFGPVSICVNNAGVGYVGAVADQVPAHDYDWVFAVNVFGTIHGVRAFVPRMRARGSGYIVNVASIDGLLPEPSLHHAPYCASKAAVIAFSEALRNDLRGTGIGVTVVCPGLVKSDLPASSRLRPVRYGGAYERAGADAFSGDMASHGMPADLAGRIVVAAIRDGQFLAFTHPDSRDRVRAHFESEIEAAFAWSETAVRRLSLGEA